jgi:predicted nucleic acid-binding Zn ribbon protein
MPTYVYEFIDDDAEGTGEYVEIIQKMSEDALEVHPESGRRIRRVPALPNIAGKWSDMKAKSQLSNQNLERLGFTKYERKGEGYMERVAGKQGPKSIAADD